jgi:TonB family protein
MTAYIIKSSVSLMLLFGLYWFLLRKEKLFVFNRYFLVVSVVLSLVLPFISVPVNFRVTPQLNEIIPAYNYGDPQIRIPDNITTGDVNISQPNTGKKFSLISISAILFGIYISGVMLFLIRFLRNIYLIIKRGKLSEKIRYKGYRIVLTNDKTGPCCFFSSIFLNKDDYLNGKIDRELLNHELEHVRQSHTVDIILIELVKIFYWFNPVHLLYERAIRINHEYLADNGVINDISDIKNYSDKLLSFISCNSNMSLTSGSNNSFTKLRLIMMMKSRSGSFVYGARIAVTLFMVTVFFLLLSFRESYQKPLVPNLPETGTGMDQNPVRGIVMTTDGIPLFGATITTTGTDSTSSKVTTDFDGRFNISDIQAGASILIEFPGFIGQTLKADLSSEMVIKLERDPDYKGRVFIPEVQNVTFRSSDFTPLKALVVIDGVNLDNKENFRVNPGDLKSFKLLTGKAAIDKYGDKGRDGVVEIVSYGNKTETIGRKPSINISPDSSNYNTFISVDHVDNKGRLIDIPVSGLQYVGVWTYLDLDKVNKKESRIIDITTRDFYKVKGTVVSKNEKPLPGVSVSATDNPAKEISDKDGHFVILDVRENVMLEFSLPGYKPYYLATNGAVFTTELKIELEEDNAPAKDDIYFIVEKMPQYPGGEMELKKFIATNLNYPEAARTQKAEGVVIVRFVVNTKGNVEDVKIIHKVHPALDTEVLRVVSKLEKFIPGSQRGTLVNVYYDLPVTFILPQSDVPK